MSSTPVPGDVGRYREDVPDFGFYRHPPGTVVWLKNKTPTTPTVWVFDKKKPYSLKSLEYKAYNHPALVISQSIMPGNTRINETYLVLPMTTCDNAGLAKHMKARIGRRDLEKSLPVDHARSTTDWSPLTTLEPDVVILRLLPSNGPLSNTKPRSYAKTKIPLEVSPVLLRRFHDECPLHIQPRLSFESFRQLLAYMEWESLPWPPAFPGKNPSELYYGSLAPQLSGSLMKPAGVSSSMGGAAVAGTSSSAQPPLGSYSQRAQMQPLSEASGSGSGPSGKRMVTLERELTELFPIIALAKES